MKFSWDGIIITVTSLWRHDIITRGCQWHVNGWLPVSDWDWWGGRGRSIQKSVWSAGRRGELHRNRNNYNNNTNNKNNKGVYWVVICACVCRTVRFQPLSCRRFSTKWWPNVRVTWPADTQLSSSSPVNCVLTVCLHRIWHPDQRLQPRHLSQHGQPAGRILPPQSGSESMSHLSAH